MASVVLAAAVGIGGACSWVSQLYTYNREAYMTDIQVQQASMFQEDNVFITMSGMDREEVRDLTEASVSRIGYIILVSTVILAIAGEMMFQGQIPEESAVFVLNAYMLCLGSSVFHLCLAILSGLTAALRAQEAAASILTRTIRPRWRDHFGEMAQAKASSTFEDQALCDILNPPLWHRFMTTFTEDGGADAGMDAEEEYYTSTRATSPASSSGTRPLRPHAFRYLPVPTEEAISPVSSPGRRDTSKRKGFASESWNEQAEVWGRFATFMFKCAAFGTTSLLEACHYLQVGMLYSEYSDYGWVFWAVNIIFTLLEFMMFWFLITNFNKRSQAEVWQPELLQAEVPSRLRRFIEKAMAFSWTVALCLTAGPLIGALAAVTDSPRVDYVCVPLCYFSHWMASVAFLLLFRLDDGQDDHLPKKSQDSKQWRVMVKLMFRAMCILSMLWFGFFLWATGLFRGVFGDVRYRNSQAIHLFRKSPPELRLTVVNMDLPDNYFRPHALVCPRQQVFMADEYQVYEFDQKAKRVEEYRRCRGLDMAAANVSIADLAARCNASWCWPLLLLNRDSAPAVLDCATGLCEPLFQAKAPALRFAKTIHSTGELVVAHPTSLTQYFWSRERRGWEPRWDIETWSQAEAMRKSVQALDRYKHGTADEDRLLVFRSSRELASLDLHTGKTCGRWSIPEMEEMVGGGCATFDGSAVLVFAAKWMSAARLLTADLPPAKGFEEAHVCEETGKA